MLISEAIRRLEAIANKFGDIAITGGFMTDEAPLRSITVTDSEGMEVFPEDPNGVAGRNPVDGVFLSS